MRNQTLIAVLLALLAGAALFNLDGGHNNNELKQFEEFKSTYGRTYAGEQNIFRFNIFSSNLAKIARHNADPTQTYTMGVTQFADMTIEEFISKILMQEIKPAEDVNKVGPRGLKIPSEIDWRNQSSTVLNPVKNQGGCGSCWAFSTTGTLESNVAIATGALQSFSEQQLVDCCGKKGFECLGCSGAWPEWAFNYINNAGIVLEKEYAYTGSEGACKNTPNAKKFLNSVKPWTMLQNEAIKEALGTTGPVSICVDASNWSLYRSGVFSNCGTSVLNHAVVAIGYQADGVWIVRNSWGTSWGEKGHIRLSAGNTCGLQNHALIPNLA